MKIAILANDVVPGLSLPVAAPGIRAWGLAEGLRAHGHEVTLLINSWQVDQVWAGRVPAPTPPGAVMIVPRRVHDFVQAHGIEVLVITNSNHIDSLGDLGDCRLIYDFFAPKMLELAENVDREDLAEATEQLERRKLAALGRSDAVIVNGAKKVDYVRDWLTRAGQPDLPLAVANPGLPPVAPQPADSETLEVIVTGYLQPWSQPGAWTRVIRPLLDRGEVRLHLLVGNHWGQQGEIAMHPDLAALADHPGVVRHRLLRFHDFRALLARCHLSIDVFTRNPERELAMVTRSVVALSCGLPVMHVPFTEVSPWIEEYDAGWLVEADDEESMRTHLEEAVRDRSALDRRRAGAVAISQEILEAELAAEPFDALLHGMT